jgi:hypothetical protein
MRVAMAGDPSVLPLSATTISPLILCSHSARRAFSRHASKVSASFGQGITTDTSGENAPLARIGFAMSFNLKSPDANLYKSPPAAVRRLHMDRPGMKGAKQPWPQEAVA